MAQLHENTEYIRNLFMAQIVALSKVSARR